MLLAVDIGNTNITLGLFKFANGKPARGPVKVWRLSTWRNKTADEYGTKILDLFHYALIETSQVKAVAVASVVPQLDADFEEMSRKYFKQTPFFLTAGSTSRIDIHYENPEEVGADRIANAVAAFDFYGGPVIVLDFGTATTFDCVSRKGEYLGGVIAPGPAISADSLAKHTSKLPKVSIAKPRRAIGRSTVEGIQSGLYFGYVGLVKEILAAVKKEMGGNVPVVATGGLAGMIVPAIKGVKAIDPDLTLEGIRLIWEKNA